MRRRTGGNERRWLELVVRAEEGVKKLGREGMRCGEGRGGTGEGWPGGVTAALMAVMPLKTWVRLRGD
jgi:hypothetical protein